MTLKLSKAFYQRTDTLNLAAELLGKLLCTRIDGKLSCGWITETEAYLGVEDRASHAYGGRFTPRTRIMYEAGGLAYVYRCYGIHDLFNVVTHKQGTPHAILIRAVLPHSGLNVMLHRRKLTENRPHAFTGPGKVSQGLGIQTAHTGLALHSSTIWIEDRGFSPGNQGVLRSERIGVGYAGEDARLPYRFQLTDPVPDS